MKKTVEFNGMTVADLICELEGCNPDAKVLFVCDYGDYHHTQQALPVNEISTMPMSALVESAYSQSRIACVEDDEEKQFFCQTCEEEWTSPTCPKCGAICVDEEGELADSVPDDAYSIVILKQY